MVLVLNSKSMNRMLYAAAFFMFIMGFLIHDLGFPIGTMAILDVVVFIGIIFSMRFFSDCIHNTQAGVMIAIGACLLVIAVIYGLYAQVPITLLSDGVRNSFRGIATFTVTVCLLKKETVKKIIRLAECFFWINVVVCTMQFFLLGVSHDNCNGLFGAGKMNSWTNILICMISVYNISRYMNKTKPLHLVAINIVACLYIAIIAELKAFFFELVIILMIMIFMDRPSWRKLFVCIVGGLALSAMLAVFIAFWDDNSVFTVDGLRYYFSEDRSFGYAAQGDWGRVGGIANATEKFFSQGLNLFGMGLGYCGFDTPFYDKYGWLHYNWFSYISIFLEQGWVGIVGYIAFFVVNFWALQKRKKQALTADAKTVYEISLIMSALGIFIVFYNSSVTGYPAFFLYLLVGMSYRYELDGGELPQQGILKEYHNGQLVNDDILQNSSHG